MVRYLPHSETMATCLSCPACDLPAIQSLAYFDRRIHPELTFAIRSELVPIFCKLDEEILFKKIGKLPIEWVTKTALASFSECLEKLERVS